MKKPHTNSINERRKEAAQLLHRELYTRIDTFLSEQSKMSNTEVAEALGVHPTTVANRREALGLGPSTAGKLSTDIARKVLKLREEKPRSTIKELAIGAGCNPKTAAKVLADPKRYLREGHDNGP